MSLSLYDSSVGSYLRTVSATQAVLGKAEQAAAEGVLDLEATVNFRFHDDMLPFSFQIISVWHHSMGAIEGMKAKLFQPPPKMPEVTWDTLTGLLQEANDYLAAQEQDAIDALAGQDMQFKAGSLELPFTTDSFLLSFSLPNFYFHATTTYTMLRHLGVPLGKLDFLGLSR
ncbi:MAG: DUF1993 domain-containing protein [Cellvibrionales bacterium]|jgi:hypothetical protein